MDLHDMTLRYESPRGETLEFGPESIYRFGNLDLFNASWDYEIVNDTVPGMWRTARTSKLVVYIDAPTQSAGVEARNKLEDVFDDGAAQGAPGRLYAGEWYTRCLCVGQEKDAWWFDGRYFACELTLLRPDPVWTREQVADYVIERIEQGTSAGIDHPYDHPHDYSNLRTIKSFDLDAREPAACRITIFGPAKSPYVWVGSNRYKVNVDVPAGGLLIIDGRERSVTLIDPNGNHADAYTLRQRGSRGSGNYVFERIAPGYNVVAWDNSFGFELRAYVERSAPAWTI